MKNDLVVAKLANLVRKRAKQDKLPININLIASSHSEIKHRDIPFNIDGVTYRRQDKSNIIIINTNKPLTRRRFTLAHELGHVIIPWHTGIIVDTDCFDFYTNENYYPELESEANEFASELLLPKEIIIPIINSKIDSKQNIGNICTDLSELANTSLLATIFKIFPQLYSNACFVVTDESKKVKFAAKNIQMYMKIPSRDQIFDINLYQNCNISLIERNNLSYYFIQAKREKNIRRSKTIDWRPFLQRIMDEQNFSKEDRYHYLQSINGVVGSFKSFYLKKDPLFNQAYHALHETFSGRPELMWLVKHEYFDKYLHAKLNDLFNK